MFFIGLCFALQVLEFLLDQVKIVFCDVGPSVAISLD